MLAMVSEYEKHGGLNLGCDDLVIMPPNHHHPNHQPPSTTTNGSKDLASVTDDTRTSNGPQLHRMEIEEPSGPSFAASASARESRISDDLGILDGSSNGWRCGGGCCRLIEGSDKGSSRKTPANQLARSLSALRHGNRRVIVVGLVAVCVVMVIVAITIYCCRGGTESEIPVTGTNHTLLGRGRVVQDVLPNPNQTLSNCDQQTLRTFLIRSLEYELRKLVEKTKFREQCTGFHVARINLEDGFFEFEVVCIVVITGDQLMRDWRADLVELLGKNLQPSDVGIFVFDLASLRLQTEERHELVTTEPPPSNTPVVIPICLSVPYNRTCYPNILHHQSQMEALSAGLASVSMLEAPCNDHLYLLWCSVFVPDCTNDVPLPPCRSLCKAVLTDCPQLRPKIEDLLGDGCSSLPDEDGTSSCTGIPKTTTDTSQKKCDDVPIDVCRDLGFTLTSASGNLLGQTSRSSLYWWGQLENIAERTHCSPHLMTFGCSVFYPQCTEAEETIGKPELVGPCESLCLAVKSDCGFFFSLAGIHFLTDYNCSNHLQSQTINQHTCAGSAVEFNSTDVDCSEDQFQCGDPHQCISSRWICDGRTDCNNGDDEKDCAECPSRDESHYRCNNGQCLHLAKRCDGHVDCPDAEDEVDCLRLSTEDDAVKSFVEIYNEETKDWDPVCISHPFDEDLTGALCNLNRLTVIENNGRIVNDSTILRYLSTRTNCSQHQRSYVHCNYSDCTNGPLPGQVSHLYESLRFRGETLDDGDWPWVVSLHGGRRRSFYCGGFLITDQWVLTAAHCIGRQSQPGDLTVMAGHSRRTAFDRSRQVRSVIRLAVHPHFSAVLLNDDIALLLVDQPFRLGPRVRSLCLPDTAYQPKEGQTCYVGGWGKTSDTDRDYSEVLRLRQLTVESLSWCNRDPSGHAHSLNGAKILCTTARQDSGDIYQGDSGSAVLCESSFDEEGGHPRGLVLAGVVSSGFEGGQTNISKALTVQTAIASYTDWIRQEIATSS